MRNTGLYAAGLTLGAANTVRHKAQGYVNPRPFAASDVQRTLDHAFEVVDRWEEHGAVEWKGKRVLECGPGSDMATGALMLARGASSYTAVDRFDNRDQASPALYQALADRTGAHVAPDSLRFVQGTFPELSEVAGEVVDLIVSNATLEHIDQIPELFATFGSRAAAGATMVHHIDAQTHMRWIKDVDPLNILRYSDRVYDRVLTFPGAPNRLRAHDYEQAAERAGWVVKRTVPDITADTDYLSRTRLAPRYRGTDGLDLLTFTLVAAWPDPTR